MKIYVHNYLEPLKINSSLYEEKHADQIGNAFDLSEHHYLSDINLDYWIYKNSNEDIIGKFQYRKWFLNNKKEIYSEEEIKNILTDHDIMIGGGIMNIAGHSVSNRTCYNYHHNSVDLRLAEQITTRLYGEQCAQAFTKYLDDYKMLVYANLYIAKKEIIMEYYNWMFPVLVDFLNLSSFKTYSSRYQQRAPGYIAERLFSFWCLLRGFKFYLTDTNIEEASADKNTQLLRFSYP